MVAFEREDTIPVQCADRSRNRVSIDGRSECDRTLAHPGSRGAWCHSAECPLLDRAIAHDHDALGVWGHAADRLARLRRRHEQGASWFEERHGLLWIEPVDRLRSHTILRSEA